jgi:hypothetical protein
VNVVGCVHYLFGHIVFGHAILSAGFKTISRKVAKAPSSAKENTHEISGVPLRQRFAGCCMPRRRFSPIHKLRRSLAGAWLLRNTGFRSISPKMDWI